MASVSDSSLGAAAHIITATYSGDGDFSGSVGSLTQGVIGVLTVQNNSDSGTGSLRARSRPPCSGDTIEFAPGLAGKTITLGSTLTLSTSLEIDGLGANELTVEASDKCGVFDIGSASATVGISGLTIKQGMRDLRRRHLQHRHADVTGCNINDNASPGSSGSGGGIYNKGTLTVSNCTTSGQSNSAYYGGAIYNIGTATVTGSTISGDSARMAARFLMAAAAR